MSTLFFDNAQLKPGRHCHQELILEVTYALYKSITDLMGEKGWEVVWKTGEYIWQDLKKQYQITDTDPKAVFDKVGQWLKEVGYIREIEVEMPTENELTYIMDTSVVRPSVMRLKEEKAVLPHWSTAILVAALRDNCGLVAETDLSKPEILSPTRTREYWKLHGLE